MTLSDSLDDFGVDEVIRDDLGELGEVPSVPLLQSHDVVVDFLIKVIQQAHCLDDHDIDLLSGELQLVSRETVGNTQSHHAVIFLVVD